MNNDRWLKLEFVALLALWLLWFTNGLMFAWQQLMALF